ncbi:MAG TPA: glutathione S-transferase N-terminal domain-containing protein [Gaiellaceae bacterium]|nr:glutathione S-transferase N-terminal domain-containing protein [Gaiellaceae bacterium]
MWVKIGAHPCWRVQRELDAAGIEYDVVPGPVRRSKRSELEALSGQRLYPVIEFEDGTVYREESKDMAARIKAGTLLGALTHHDNLGHDGHDVAHEAPVLDTESM